MTEPARPATMRDLSEWLMALRSNHQPRLSRDRLAAKAGVSSATIARLEGKATNHPQPQPETLAAVLRALGVNAETAEDKLHSLELYELADGVLRHYDDRPAPRQRIDLMVTLDSGQTVGIEVKGVGLTGPQATLLANAEIAQALREARPTWQLLVDYEITRADALEAHRRSLEAADRLAEQRSDSPGPSPRGLAQRRQEG